MTRVKDNPILKAALLEKRRQGQYAKIREKLNSPNGVLVESHVRNLLEEYTTKLSKLIDLNGFFLTKNQFFTFESYLSLLKMNIFINDKNNTSYYTVRLKDYKGTEYLPTGLLDSKLYTVYRTQKQTIKNFK